MTAKELKEQARFGEGMRSRRKGYKFYDDEFQTFCETLCREQREICENAFYKGRAGNKGSCILNAPMPDL